MFSSALQELRIRFFLCLVFGFGCSYPSNAIETFYDWRESGLPIVEHFDTMKTGHNPQNYSIKQDKKGYIYVGNGAGILIYNGNSWQLIEHGDQRVFRDFALSNDGKIYTGTNDQIGYFSADDKGTWSFFSLSDNISELPDLSSGILRVKIAGPNVFFASNSHLFYYNQQKGLQWIKKVVNPLDFFVNKNVSVLIASKDNALYSFNPITEKLSVIVEQLKEPVLGFVNLNDTHTLAYTQSHLFQLRQGNILEPLVTDIEPWLLDNWITHVISYDTDSMVVGTEKGGVAILTLNGKLKRFYNSNHGLPSNIVNRLFVDREMNLWIASGSNGISRVELSSPISYFSNASEYSISTSTAILKDKVFVAALEGLLELVPATSPGEQAYFRKLTVTDLTYLLSFMPDDEELLIGHSLGVASLSMDKNSALRFSILLDGKANNGAHVRQIIRSRFNPDIAYGASRNGLIKLAKKEGYWQFNGNSPAMEEAIYSIREDSKGDLWVGTFNGRFFHVTNLTNWPSVDVRPLDHPLAKPPTVASLFYLGEDILFNTGSSSGEVLTLSVDEKSLVNSEIANWDDADVRWLVQLHQSNLERAWFSSWDEDFDMDRIGMLSHTKNNRYDIDLLTLDRLRLQFTMGIFESPDGIVWINGKDSIIRYNTNLPSRKVELRPPVLTKVEMLGSSDILFFNNNFEQGQKDIGLREDQNAIRLSFSSVQFQYTQNTQFRYRLGNEAWSDWQRKKSVELTNLEPSVQNFEVQYRISPTAESPSLTFNLNREPYFEENWWAKLLFVLLSISLAILFSVFFFRSRNRIAMRRAKLLKLQVLERTKTIQQQNLRLNEQNDQLLKLDQAKSNFFTNIAHEFRTPLTLSIGPLKEIESSGELLDQQNKRYLEIALKNNMHLLDLLGQVTDINRLEAGKLPVKLVKMEIVPHLERCISRFEFLIQELGLTIETVGFEERVVIDFDEEHFEKIVLNLLSNAIKHSPPRGKITIGLVVKEKLPVLRIKDQGPGINKEERKNIFRRFYRIGKPIQSTQPSTGIGLALVKELVNLHKISIEVVNNKAKGACFILTFNIPTQLGTEKLGTLEPSSIEWAHVHDVDNLQLTDLKKTSFNNPKKNHLKKIVLVVDDNDELREFISSLLLQKYTVVEASDGEVALRIAIETEPDIIISDVMMPVMDGFSLTKQLKSSPITNHIPLILLTARSTKLDTIKGLQYGADDYLVKPFDNNELIARIAALLAHSKRVADKILSQFEHPVHLPVLGNLHRCPNDIFSKRLEEILIENLGDLYFDVDELSRQMNTTRSTLFRKTKKRFGCTPGKLLKTFRLNTALQMLREKRGTISEIGYAVGFHNLSSFGRAFNEFYKVPPSHYEEIP